MNMIFIGKKGSMVVEVFVFFVTVVLTSAVVLLLVQKGVLTVRADSTEVNVLNTEFIPFGRGGEVVITHIQFCQYVDEQFNCLEEGNQFQHGERVYVLFTVESSPFEGDIMLLRNYRITSPSGREVLQLDERNTYHLDVQTEKERETVVFSNYFDVSDAGEQGEYLLDVVVENPLLEKKVTVQVPFTITT